jgi:phosphoribosylaminoimidazole-succinocarboxamide synthase
MREYQELKRQILALGWARPGSLIRRYMPCGNPACRCMSKQPRLHGPYFQWSHKIGGKTRSLRLSEDQARMAKEWAENYRKLKRLLRRMERFALQETDRILGTISRS